jgi:hypothetical protein
MDVEGNIIYVAIYNATSKECRIHMISSYMKTGISSFNDFKDYLGSDWQTSDGIFMNFEADTAVYLWIDDSIRKLNIELPPSYELPPNLFNDLFNTKMTSILSISSPREYVSLSPDYGSWYFDWVDKHYQKIDIVT